MSKKVNKISYSAWGKYLICPEMYRLHYVEKMRPTDTSSALLFGSAMDDVLNEYLMKKGSDPFELFKKAFPFEDFDGCNLHRDDYEDWLFSEEQLKRLAGKSEHFKAWASMRIKGRILLEKYQELVMPNIISTEATQVSLTERRGFIDAIMEIKGHGRVLIDHKTSARPYKYQQTKDSMQLSLYARELGIKKIGYIVMIKKIYKTDRYPQIQMFVDDVDNHIQDITIQSITDVERAIELEVFPRNLNACGKIFGKSCMYMDKCWKKEKK